MDRQDYSKMNFDEYRKSLEELDELKKLQERFSDQAVQERKWAYEKRMGTIRTSVLIVCALILAIFFTFYVRSCEQKTIDAREARAAQVLLESQERESKGREDLIHCILSVPDDAITQNQCITAFKETFNMKPVIPTKTQQHR